MRKSTIKDPKEKIIKKALILLLILVVVVGLGRGLLKLPAVQDEVLVRGTAAVAERASTGFSE